MSTTSAFRPLGPTLGLALVCIAAALWATVGVADRLMRAPDAVDPALSALLRTALGAASLLVAGALVPGARAGRAPLAVLLAFGLAGALFQVSLFAAFERVGVTVTVAVTVCAPPLIVAAADAAVEHRPPDPRLAAAIGVATLGVGLACWPEAAPAPGVALDAGGVGLLAVASTAFAGVAMSARALTQRIHPIRASGLGLAVTAALLVPVVALGDGPTPLGALAALDGFDAAVLAYMGVAATGGAYLAFAYGLRLCRSAGAGLAATMIEPVVAAILAAALLGERLAWPAALGCGMMLGAMVMLVRYERLARELQ